MRNYGDVGREKKKENYAKFLSFWVLIINGLVFVTQSGTKCSEESFLFTLNDNKRKFTCFFATSSKGVTFATLNPGSP